MAWTAHTDPEQIKEHRELEESVERKAETMAQWIKESQNFIIFTGAGVSTSAGIPDFRGPTGVWTLRAQGKETTGGTSSLKAIPTPTHMSIVALTNLGLNKYLISQNTDGLHRKSGIHPEKLSELHGNTNLEICERCGKQYLRDFHTRTAHDVHEHLTGRRCTKCDGNLQDSIINFGESLPQIPMQRAFNWASKADLCLVLGSSLTVTPAADMPRMVAQHGGKLVICNLQQTPLDNIAALRVFATSDDFMKQVMKKLDLEIPEWRLHRRVIIGNTYNAEAKTWSVYVRGIDVDGTPVSFIRSVTIQGPGFRTDLDKESFETRQFPSKLGITPAEKIALQVSLKFMGFYMEPELTIDYTAKLHEPVGAFYHLEYNPFRREWRTEMEKQFGFSDFTQWGNRELLNKLAALKVDTRGATERQDLLNLLSMNYKGT